MLTFYFEKKCLRSKKAFELKIANFLMDSPVFFCKNWYNLCSFIDIKVQKSTKSHNCLMIFNIKNNVLKKGNDNLFVWHQNPLSNVIFDIKMEV